MTKTVYIEGLGNLTYTESFWTGKKTITVDGVKAQRLNKKTYKLGERTISLNGNYLKGLKLGIDGEEHVVYEKTAAYEYILAALPFIIMMIWGNIPALLNIFPIISGAIGGAITGLIGVSQIVMFRNIKSPGMKVFASLVVLALTMLLLFVLAIVFTLLFFI